MNNLIYPQLSYKITGLLYKVHNKLGRFCRERQYCDAFEILLTKSQVRFKREKDLIINFQEGKIGGNVPDFLVEDLIVIDFKAKKFVTKEDYNQMQRYLILLDKKLGFIVNFRSTYLKPKRIINYHKH